MNHQQSQQSTASHNPCTDILSDHEYLEHMIPHHQVAIDMSIALQNANIANPTMLYLCRNIIRKQDYEIWEMTMMMQQLSDTVFTNELGSVKTEPTKLEVYNPFVGKAKCNPLFFKPDEHKHQMQHKLITSDSYLKHMIPHHQVAVDMSKRLLLHTNHSYLMDFCRKLIIDQQYEIVLMTDLLRNKYQHQSCLI